MRPPRHVPVYAPAVAGSGSHCAYPQRDGQAKLNYDKT